MSLFRVYVDGALFYHPQMSKLAITDARIEEDAENIDSLTLSAPHNHPYLSAVRPLASTIVCKKGNAVVFEGRALDNGTDFYNTHEQLGIDAKAVNDLIARNARVAQDQKEYNERYDALVNRYEETEHKRDAVMEQIDQIMIRRRKIERFIDSVKGLPGVLTSCASIRFPHEFGKLSRSAARPSPIKTRFDGNPETEFDESLWAGLVDSMTVHSKDRIVFRLTGGMEMEG